MFHVSFEMFHIVNSKLRKLTQHKNNNKSKKRSKIASERKKMSDFTSSFHALAKPLKQKVHQLSDKSQLYQYVSA